MAVYLKITDGTTTIDLLGNDATNSFNLIEGSWAPNVARRKRSQMGGGSWAEDVVEALPLYAKSDTSAATVLANIDALAALMDQAQRWALGEAVDPVILRYSPNSSTVYVQAVILGPPDNAQAVVLPPTFTDDLHQNDVVKGVTLQFKRRGLWLGAEESDTTAAAVTPAEHNFSFATTPKVASPVKLEVSGFAQPALGGRYPKVVLITGNSFKTAYQNDRSSTTTTAPGSGTFANTTMNTALDSDVWRIAPISAGEYKAIDKSSGINTSLKHTGLYAIFACVRNNSSTIFYTAKGRMWEGNALQNEQVVSAETGTTIIAANPSPLPVIHYLGMVGFDPIHNIGAVELEFSPSATTGAAGNGLDLDYFVVVAMEPMTSIMTFPVLSNYGTSLVIDHAYLSKVKPQVLHKNGGFYSSVTYNGSPMFYTDSDEFMAFIMGTTEEYFQVWGGDPIAKKSLAMTATITQSYLVPK